MISQLPRLLFLFLFIAINSIHAQDTNYFSLSAGTNIIDNSNGKIVPWDAKRVEFSNPFYLELDYRFGNHISVALLGTANVFNIARSNPSGTGLERKEYDFFGVDISGKYYIDPLLFDNPNIDLYAGLGLGFHDVANDNAFTANLSLGFNYWFQNNFGIAVQAMAKKGIGEEVPGVNNYYQYNIGVSYRFLNASKAKKQARLAEKVSPETEEEKEEAIVEVIVDDTETPATTNGNNPNANNAPDSTTDRLLDANNVTVEKTEANQLAAFQEELNALGVVYFDRNSSYYYKSEKLKLDTIIQFLLAHPNIQITINSYTDPTGTEKYNNWLSERRLQRVKTYMTTNGVAPERLESFSKGVDPANTCNADHTNCTEAEHQQQRRVEFIVSEI
ncbi:OmpA family protein [Bizionia sediminis]|uniref:OmpA family protein n=1 Tax=Bizionia sediminis TaxID=1737064 RepID=A0ABW5KSE7_9FLAO